MTSQIDPSQATMKHLLQKSRLSNWMGMLGGQIMKRNAEQQYKTLAAEQAWVRRQWGATEKPEEDEMGGNTYLGDIHHQNPQPIVINSQPPQKSGLGALATLALASLGPAGVIGGMVLDKVLDNAPVVQPVQQEPQKISTTINNEEVLDIQMLQESDLIP